MSMFMKYFSMGSSAVSGGFALGMVKVCFCMAMLGLSATAATYYVSPTGSDAAGIAGTSAESAFASVSNALDHAVDGDVIRIAEGTYTAMAPMVNGDRAYLGYVTNAVTIVGAGEDKTILRGVFGGAKYACGFRLANKGAVVRDLALTYCYCQNSAAPHTEELGVALQIDAGRAENCRVFNNKAYINATSHGMDSPIVFLTGADSVLADSIVTNNGMSAWGRFSAVYTKGAVVTNTLIKGNWTDDAISNDNHAGGITIKGGVVSDCRIIGNFIGTGNDSKAVPVGGVRILGGGVIERCYIASNRNHRAFNGNTAGGLYATGECTIRNCIFEGNSAGQGASSAGAVQLRDAKCKLYHCTIVRNSALGAGGLVMANGEAVGNIIVNNTITGMERDVMKSGGTIRYSCFGEATEEDEDGNTCAAPRFAVDMPYAPTSRRCLDAVLSGGNLVADDFYGRARPVYGESGNDYPDMGAIESDNATHSITIELRPIPLIGSGRSATLVAEVYPADVALVSVDWRLVSEKGTVIEKANAGLTPTFDTLASGLYDVIVTVTPTEGEAVTETFDQALKVKSLICYVGLEGSNTFPYDTPETATRSLLTAIDSVFFDDDTVGTVRILDGNYPTTLPMVEVGLGAYFAQVNVPVALIGNNADPSKVKFNFSLNNRYGGGIMLSHPRASLSGVTVTGTGSSYQGGSTTTADGAAIHVASGATVSNCVVSGISYTSSRWGQPYVTMTGGLIRNLTVTNFYIGTKGSGGWCYNEVGVRVTGGTLENCLIGDIDCDEMNSCAVIGLGLYGGVARNVTVRNCSGAWASSNGHANHNVGITVSGNARLEDAVITNCFNTYNKSQQDFAGLRVSGGVARNVLVANTCTTEPNNAAAGAGLDLRGGSVYNVTVSGTEAHGQGTSGLRVVDGTLTNAIVWGSSPLDGAEAFRLTGRGRIGHSCFEGAPAEKDADGNFAADPEFRNVGAGDYSLRIGSRCRNAGDNAVWVNVAEPLDLKGCQRIFGKYVDLGCYELLQSPGMAILLR